MSSRELVVLMKDIVKVYPDGTVALRGVNLELKRGEIHGLLGENGAGKTTLMKILSGLIKPTRGEIYVKGKKVSLKNPAHALSLGIGMVHQHLSLVPVFTAYENIVLGLKNMKPGKTEIEKLMDSTGLKVPLDEVTENLSLGVRQRIEILKMLLRNVDVLILDEPTTNLSPIETRELFKSLRSLKEQGKTIVLITHKIREILEITDRVTVLRKGRVVGSVETNNTNSRELARMMVGREVILEIDKPPVRVGEVALEIEDLHVMSDVGGEAVKGVSFDVRYGEIFGIAGVEGNGQVELAEAIAGIRRVLKGRILLGGKDVTQLSTRERYSMGLSYIPEDRRIALAMDMSVAENSVLTRIIYDKTLVNKMGFLSFNEILRQAMKLVKEFDIVISTFSSPVRTLSGGNQQKLVVGRELSREPSVILAVQPTRGLDVGATEYIRRLLVKMRNEGKAVLLISSDLDEVMGLSDRMAVMYNGRFTGIVDPRKVTEEEVGLMMGGYSIEEIRHEVN
ncbi:MAG: ABC transporter ATP-binding protein [Desulfurococcaceae archaeon]